MSVEVLRSVLEKLEAIDVPTDILKEKMVAIGVATKDDLKSLIPLWVAKLAILKTMDAILVQVVSLTPEQEKWATEEWLDGLRANVLALEKLITNTTNMLEMCTSQ